MVPLYGTVYKSSLYDLIIPFAKNRNYDDMRSENDSYQDASSRYYNYLNQLENLARYTSDLARKAYMEGNYSAATSWMNSALNYWGCLVHTYSDSFSPSHAGFQYFTYWNAPEHLYN